MPSSIPPTLFVVLADPPPEREAELNHWYDVVHGPDALENGSFTGLRRYRAVGPGWRQAPYLALWEGTYRGEAEAWDYIRPRARQLQAEGRIGDTPSAVDAAMLFAVDVELEPWPLAGGGRWLTTLQNDWRAPDPTVGAGEWLAGLRPGRRPYGVYTADPDGRSPGRHLALFAGAPDDAGEAEAPPSWAAAARPGMSPTPPFSSMFDESRPRTDGRGEPPGPVGAWVMRWEPVATLGRDDRGTIALVAGAG